MQIQPEFFEKLKPRYSNNGVFQLINTSILNAFGLNDKNRGEEMSHYYDEQPDVKSNPKRISYQIKNAQLELTTDAGVFSKDNVDFGSDLLIMWIWSYRFSNRKSISTPSNHNVGY